MKDFLKKYPKIYSFLQKRYYNLRKLLETKVFGTKFQELFWKMRKKEQGVNYCLSSSHPHRDLLIKTIEGHNPESILEVGSASGPNLILLAQKFPKVEIKGIDINSNFVKMGNRYFQEKSILNVKLFKSKADNLDFKDKSFDLVFTDAVLIHIGPDKIKKVVNELKRVAKKSIILLEHHSEEVDELGFYNNPRWLRNYRKLFKDCEVKMTKISSDNWEGDWGRYGYIIEIIL